MRIMLIDVTSRKESCKSENSRHVLPEIMESSEVFFARLFISFYYFNAAAEKYATCVEI